MSRAVLALGSNLGDRFAHLEGAVAGLGEAVRAVSGVYENPPWSYGDQGGGDQGGGDQPYLNAVVLVAAKVPPRGWLDRARALEAAAGRVRDPLRRLGPRTLDVDVIAVWRDDGAPVCGDDPELTLPHPRAHLRAFVLRPWLDVAPQAHLPGHGWVRDLLRCAPVAAELPGLVPRPELDLSSSAAHRGRTGERSVG